MPPQARLADKSTLPACVHGCLGCPHPCDGPAVLGSPNVLVNNRPAIRATDKGVHKPCCMANFWTALKGSATVMINNLPAHRKGDTDTHCGGVGLMAEGSDNV